MTRVNRPAWALAAASALVSAVIARGASPVVGPVITPSRYDFVPLATDTARQSPK